MRVLTFHDISEPLSERACYGLIGGASLLLWGLIAIGAHQFI